MTDPIPGSPEWWEAKRTLDLFGTRTAYALTPEDIAALSPRTDDAQDQMRPAFGDEVRATSAEILRKVRAGELDPRKAAENLGLPFDQDIITGILELASIAPPRTDDVDEWRMALDELRAVLCDPDGRVCIDGSDGDRAVIQQALAMLAAAPHPVARERTEGDEADEDIGGLAFLANRIADQLERHVARRRDGTGRPSGKLVNQDGPTIIRALLARLKGGK